jgi:hypothetical protein
MEENEVVNPLDEEYVESIMKKPRKVAFKWRKGFRKDVFDMIKEGKNKTQIIEALMDKHDINEKRARDAIVRCKTVCKMHNIDLTQEDLTQE